jgi:hypothetical protein
MKRSQTCINGIELKLKTEFNLFLFYCSRKAAKPQRIINQTIKALGVFACLYFCERPKANERYNAS